MLVETVTRSGKLLKPMLIFNGQANGRIEEKRFKLTQKIARTLANQKLG
jgi:hypothetical protein